MLIMIDNYDSFTYNLVQYFGELGAELKIFRNDAATVEQIAALNPSQIVISPGPGVPDDAGISKELFRQLGTRVPMLGVCLGHQCIGEVYGGTVSRAALLMHGKTSPVHHNGSALFAGIPSPFTATRYHSLIVEDPLPPELEITAHTEAGEIMALQHKTHPVYGVQFHPESILTEAGMQILKNFMEIRD